MEQLDLEGAWLCTPQIHADQRGNFHEWFSKTEVEGGAGHRLDVAQANCSVSRRGVIRGIHFSDVPPGQAKYVTCANGAILDVIVDIRCGSPEFGRWVAVELTADNRHAVYIEAGLGHAFAALTDEAKVLYLCSTGYDPRREHGVHPLDPDIGIDWPVDIDPILSDRDAAAPSLAAALSDRLLPEYARCQALAIAQRSDPPDERTAGLGVGQLA
jgi:dTDP-4-dehydrorhamnose 3,5-epimerase